jgi:plastocyanin
MKQITRGARVGLAAVAVVGAIAVAGVAGAAQDTEIDALDSNQWSAPAVSVATGDSVTWNFAGTSTHNVVSTNDNDRDARWSPFAYKGDFQAVSDGSSTTYTFYKSGTYTYQCQFHGGMTGTIEVTGQDQDIPSQTPTPTPTPTATPPGGGTQPSPSPTPDDHTSTPAPSPAADTTRPAISRVKLRALKHAARVRFRLSEPATVTLSLRKGKRTVRSLHLQARAGTRTVTVRRLAKARYTVMLRARDAMGNRSAMKRSPLRIRR